MNTRRFKTIHAFTRFQHKGDLLARLLESHPDFLALCEDYDACVTAFHYWGNLDKPDSLLRASEYHSIMEELEKEIQLALVLAEK
jgi:hypothetical protein